MTRKEKNLYLIFSYVMCFVLGSILLMLTVMQPDFPRTKYITSITLEQKGVIRAFVFILIIFGVAGVLLIALSTASLILNLFYNSNIETTLRYALSFLFGLCAMSGPIFAIVVMTLIPSKIVVNIVSFISHSPSPSGTSMILTFLFIVYAFLMVGYYQKIFNTLNPNSRPA